ncbi:MAG: hypothetical protein IH948_02265, partial [Bacteroidetes bacterium]|nr:hypothetical protein [Bacteroidota bacterium]
MKKKSNLIALILFIQFTTTTFQSMAQCNPIPAPWMDDVESHTPTDTLDTSNCWITTASGDYDWNISGVGTTPSPFTGPLVAYSGNNFFYIEATVGNFGDTAKLTSPEIDLTALTNPYLRFYYHMFGLTMGNLYLDVWNGTTWTIVDSIIGQQQLLQTDAWLKKSVNLSTFSDTIVVRFRAISVGVFQGDISIDDIWVGEAPTCIPPSLATATNIATTSADLGWTENGSATQWDIEWGPTGFTPGTGTTLFFSGANPYTLSGLTSSTTYDFYVNSDCGGGDLSDTIGPHTFTTICPPFVAPWLDDAEGHAPTTVFTSSMCWSASETGLYTWNISGTGTTPSVGTGP